VCSLGLFRKKSAKTNDSEFIRKKSAKINNSEFIRKSPQKLNIKIYLVFVNTLENV